MEYDQLLQRLKTLPEPKTASNMRRLGISLRTQVYGIAVPDLRKLAKEIRKNHLLAEQLWESSIHEARILSTRIADPRKVSEAQMDRWVDSFDAWDICDQCCGNLFDQTPWAYQKAPNGATAMKSM